MWMTEDVATIGPETPIIDAAALMALRGIRRLPVVEQGSKGSSLVGMVSATDILRAFPNDVNPFAVTVEDTHGTPVTTPVTAAEIMSRHVPTTTPETPIEEAAALMRDEKVGVLPVLRDQRLIGLITESDVFRAFVGLLTSPQGGVRITFDISQGEDVFGMIAQVALKRGVRVVSLLSSAQDNRPVCVVRLMGAGVDRLLDDLWSSGHRVLNVLRFPERK
jgi:acetoin utilization protein AcuB